MPLSEQSGEKRGPRHWLSKLHAENGLINAVSLLLIVAVGLLLLFRPGPWAFWAIGALIAIFLLIAGYTFARHLLDPSARKARPTLSLKQRFRRKPVLAAIQILAHLGAVAAWLAWSYFPPLRAAGPPGLAVWIACLATVVVIEKIFDRDARADAA